MELLRRQIEEHKEVIAFHEETLLQGATVVGLSALRVLDKGGKILLFGNGGSAADAQHIAAEFTGRFLRNRRALPAIALTTDTSALTAIGNDYGYENVFSRQVEALALKGDLIIGITTSGNSLNVVRALEVGNMLGCETVSFTGRDGGRAAEISNFNINIEHVSTARVQECHILLGHLICSVVDNGIDL
jgi:D-sedoheptulose 7-phosphate isomerase